ncbi:Rap guanine nucleotide exchange factor 5 [Liparis tanakae]|uniref:Rap guanine nucleotide exchange factor 5 n=1 Tax=Liparis tanakae TaxID=230148 RepID=A0A4Z2IKG3_9TELE|nr:Rap guanine nucleotide exchange factor 5 [Liparis tanakae]
MSWDCGLRYMFSESPALQPGNTCQLQDKEDLSRLEAVQRLAKDGCRFLQHHSKGSERTSEPQSDEAVRLCLRERGHDVLILQRISSEQPALSATARGGGRVEARNRSSSDGTSRAEPVTMPTFDVPYFRYIDDEGTEGDEEWSSSRSLSSIEEDSSTDSVVSDRYVVVSGTPEKILEHLLNDLTLDDDPGTPPSKESGRHACALKS